MELEAYIKGSPLEGTKEWEEKASLIRDPQADKIAKKCIIRYEVDRSYDENIRVELVLHDGRKTIPFSMTPEQFLERSGADFIQDLWALSDNPKTLLGTVSSVTGMAWATVTQSLLHPLQDGKIEEQRVVEMGEKGPTKSTRRYVSISTNSKS